MRTTVIRFLRVFIAGALVGGWQALSGDSDFQALLQTLTHNIFFVALFTALGKYLRERYGWTWIPF